MRDPWRALAEAAVLAPSADNTQPWRFEADPENGLLRVYLDETRDPSPMNAGQRMSRIACGAAIENILRAATAMGWPAVTEPGTDGALADVRFESEPLLPEAEDSVLPCRATNRRVYEGRPVEPEILAELSEATPEDDGLSTCWLTGREALDPFARLESRAFALVYGTAALRRAILGNVRFDLPRQVSVEEGLSVASLEVNVLERLLLRGMRSLPDWLLKSGGMLRFLAAYTRKLVRSASGLCVVLAPNDSEETDLRVGRAMQRAWLALTARGLAAQPMMTLPLLDNVLLAGSNEACHALDIRRVEALLHEWPRVLPEAYYLRPAFVLRFGYASGPTGRSGRRPAGHLLRIRQSAAARSAALVARPTRSLSGGDT